MKINLSEITLRVSPDSAKEPWRADHSVWNVKVCFRGRRFSAAYNAPSNTDISQEGRTILDCLVSDSLSFTDHPEIREFAEEYGDGEVDAEIRKTFNGCKRLADSFARVFHAEDVSEWDISDALAERPKQSPKMIVNP